MPHTGDKGKKNRQRSKRREMMRMRDKERDMMGDRGLGDNAPRGDIPESDPDLEVSLDDDLAATEDMGPGELQNKLSGDVLEEL